jgi:hypothetical protein
VETIQQIGSYAGFAAVVGLAVLSALYFSQARDLRRLREWAGRAPDRPAPPRSAAEGRAAGAQAERQPPVSESAAGAGEVLAGQGTGPGPVRPAQAGAGATATALSEPPAAQRGVAAPTGPPSVTSARSSAVRPTPSAARNGGPARPAPVRGAGEPRPSSERSASLRYVVLAVVGALIVIAAGTFAVGALGGREEPAPAPRASNSAPPSTPGAPSSVTFSVLNGTGVDGLGKQVADELEAAGYRRGNVTNASEQKAESVVLYARTSRADALAVAREIDVSQTEPIDASSQVLAGDASVVVIAGADQAQ